MQVKIREFFYISNLLSLSRILLVIPIIYLIIHDSPTGNIVLIALSLLAASTDMLDGYLSRRLNQITDLGILLDPVADKVVMALVFITLIIYRDFPVPLIVFLLYRDLWIMISGSLLLNQTGKPMMANLWGKINTFVFAAIALIFMIGVSTFTTNILIFIGYFTLLVSTISYGISGLRVFTKNTFARVVIWLLVFVPAIGIFIIMRGLKFFV